MMKCNIKKTTHIVAFATLIGMLLGCSHKKVEIGEVYSDVDLINEFGNPTTVDTIVLKKGVSLYEFQGGLDKYIPQKDSLCIIQYIFNLFVWAIGTEKNKRIIDFLKWDKKERNY